MSDKYCFFCMSCLENGLCRHCGKNNSEYAVMPHYLLPGTVLNGKYEIGAVIGEGGFGITYIGRDITLDIKIAVKEYYPSGFVNRNNSCSAEVISNMGDAQEIFSKGKASFLEEARVLAKFSSEQSCVSVRDFFESNNTAYIVMEYLEGINLKTYIERHGKLSFEETVSMMNPIMSVLEKIHSMGLIHRDITPANIMVLSDGKVKLLDFGAARNVSAGAEKSLSILLKPGYAPEEQYRTKGSQGAWTDVYSLSATMYKMITGVTPIDAMNRLFSDDLESITALNPSVTQQQERVILKGMAIEHEKRFQSMKQLQDACAVCLTGSNNSAAYEETEKTVSSFSMPQTIAGSAVQNNAGSEVTESVYKPKSPIRPAVQPHFDNKPAESQQTANSPAEKPHAEKRHVQRQKVPKVKYKDSRFKKPFIIIGVIAAIAAVIIIFIISMKSLTTVTIGDQNISKDKTKVYLSGKIISNQELEKLKELKKMEHLTLSNCFVDDEDVEMLSELTWLKELEISNNTDITDVSPLNKLVNLTELNISNTSVEDISCLSDLKNLNQLSINNTKISDLECISAYTSLETLRMDDLENLDADTISLPASLNMLSCEDNNLDNIEFISSCDKLRMIFASHNNISDLSPFENLENISSVYFSQNKITDISPVCKESLYNMSMGGNMISDISMLADLENITEIELSNNQISDISALAEHYKLSDVDLSKNQIEDISPLHECFHISTLDISGNKISDISVLEYIDDLSYLTMNDNQIEDISVLSKCSNIKDSTSMKLQNNKIKDISALSEFTSLNYLYIYGNEITDVSPLASCSSLQGLYMYNNNVSDLSSLTSLSNLSTIIAFDNPIADLSCLSDEVPLLNKKAKLCVTYNDNIDWEQAAALENLYIVVCDATERQKDALHDLGILSFNTADALIKDLEGEDEESKNG
ncbi:MAG: leucine-rich repeat domain-containing protein [Ruminococcus sp.]